MVEAVGVDVVHLLAHGIDFVVKSVGIDAIDDASVLELPFHDLDSGADKLSLLVVTDFQLDEGCCFLCSLTFSVEEDTDLNGIHKRYLFWYLFWYPFSEQN